MPTSRGVGGTRRCPWGSQYRDDPADGGHHRGDVEVFVGDTTMGTDVTRVTGAPSMRAKRAPKSKDFAEDAADLLGG